MAKKGRGICPFSHDYRECYPECSLYAEAVGKCSFYVSAMLLEDLQKVAVVSYEKFVREEEQYLRKRLAEIEEEEKKK
ncbi:MAG: hypothetical protein K8T10_00780 [Candidatus Eremiobacteraeota bacterium]|nr:hypothetical protein [Candidatus Eremiobacteraeota bacterium]